MDGVALLRFLAALIFVLALIGACVWAARRFGLVARTGGRTKAGQRLQLVDVLPIDTRRRAVLIRRDDVEHLVILGEKEATLVESGIKAEKPVEDSQYPVETS
ncbi:MAG TPA: flagellar biosynthetic protein FliO [Alphaproteobacteria bacterium]|nr:flagellar biosynthetic protein FliO [Alphaproteobacteria bacterium]